MEQVIYFFSHLFDVSGFPPRWFCGQWTGFHGWLYILSNVGIWAAYTSIPVWLAIFVTRRRDVPFPAIFWLFIGFILFCGMTHLLDALVFWVPAYRVNAIVLFLTAVTSLATVGVLIPTLPKAFALRSPKALEVELQAQERALHESEALFQLLVSSIRDYGICRLDPDGRVLTWNEAAEKIMGFSKEEIIGQYCSKLIPREPSQCVSAEQELEIARTQGRFEDEGWRLRKDHSRFWASVLITPIYGESGELLGYAKVVRDLTERKQSEEELRRVADDLREQTRQLQAVNKELEAFSYSVSHDLRSPLRSLDGYSQALLEDYSGRLDEKGRHYLNRIRLGSQNMAHLIDNLLNLARMSRVGLQFSEADLSAMATEVADGFQEDEPERNVEFRIEPGLKVMGDARLLRNLLQNLFDNAWKFTQDRDSAMIEFGSRREDGRTVYFVRDNGVGFDMAYSDKLFGAFQRLHGPEFPGTGIGLATAQRILNRHGGRIWAESKPDEGAVFYFELNASEIPAKASEQQESYHSSKVI
ncbi:MAG TPA: PAS domain S-box protein [Coleofasciculaceae cyanobacterium]|jgi:PAS domain S-box-containing protein